MKTIQMGTQGSKTRNRPAAVLRRHGWGWGVIVAPLGMLAGDIPLRHLRLRAAVARAPQGAVVLPDLDRHLDDAAWTLLGDPQGDAVGVAGHPQAILHQLLEIVGVGRDAVRPLGEPSAELVARARFLSQALRPADSTDAWRRDRADDAVAEAAIESALAGVAIVEAADETEEALALAIAMREALDTPGRTAALVTPDVAVARRVAAELARWGIEVEASAGRPLGETQAGVFARLALAAAHDFAPTPLAALFSDRLTRLSRPQQAFDEAQRKCPLPAPPVTPLFGNEKSAAG